MDRVVNLVFEAGFEKTPIPWDQNSPLVIHAVAGAGKSRLCRIILEQLPEAEVYTHGVPDHPTLSGRRIKPYSLREQPGPFDLIDEYLAAEHNNAKVLLADPLQYPGHPKYCHFISRVSHRFGRRTAEKLTQLGIPCSSTRFDILLTENIWKVVIEGQVIAWDPAVCKLLQAHGVAHKSPEEVRGETFDTVTVLHPTEKVPEAEQFLLYIALTRHRTKLIIGLADTIAKDDFLPPTKKDKEAQGTTSQTAPVEQEEQRQLAELIDESNATTGPIESPGATHPRSDGSTDNPPTDQKPATTRGRQHPQPAPRGPV